MVERAYSEVSKAFPFPGYMRRKLRYVTIAALIKKELPLGQRILDIGCGPCDLTAVLSRLGYSLTGVDDLNDPWHLVGNNRKRIQKFAQAFGIRLIVQSIWSFREKDVFDAVTLMDVFEHTGRPRQLLNRAVSFLKPGGLLLIQTPNSVALAKRLRSLLGRSVWPDVDFVYFNVGNYTTHVREYTATELSKMLKLSGLTKIKFKTQNFLTEEELISAKGKRKIAIRMYEVVSRLRWSFRDTILIWGTRPSDWSPFEDLRALLKFKNRYPPVIEYNLDKETDDTILSKLKKRTDRLE